MAIRRNKANKYVLWGGRFTHHSGPCSGATQRLDCVPLASFGGHNFQMAVGAMGEHMGVRGGPWGPWGRISPRLAAGSRGPAGSHGGHREAWGTTGAAGAPQGATGGPWGGCGEGHGGAWGAAGSCGRAAGRGCEAGRGELRFVQCFWRQSGRASFAAVRSFSRSFRFSSFLTVVRRL